MQFGLVNNSGRSEISQSDIKILNLERDYSLDFMFYYIIDIETIENLQVLIEFFGKISIDVDPTTRSQFIIGIEHNYDNKVNEKEVPF